MSVKQTVVSAVGWSFGIKVAVQTRHLGDDPGGHPHALPGRLRPHGGVADFVNFMLGFGSMGLGEALVQQGETPRPIVARVFGALVATSTLLTCCSAWRRIRSATGITTTVDPADPGVQPRVSVRRVHHVAARLPDQGFARAADVHHGAVLRVDRRGHRDRAGIRRVWRVGTDAGLARHQYRQAARIHHPGVANITSGPSSAWPAPGHCSRSAYIAFSNTPFGWSLPRRIS